MGVLNRKKTKEVFLYSILTGLFLLAIVLVVQSPYNIIIKLIGVILLADIFSIGIKFILKNKMFRLQIAHLFFSACGFAVLLIALSFLREGFARMLSEVLGVQVVISPLVVLVVYIGVLFFFLLRIRSVSFLEKQIEKNQEDPRQLEVYKFYKEEKNIAIYRRDVFFNLLISGGIPVLIGLGFDLLGTNFSQITLIFIFISIGVLCLLGLILLYPDFVSAVQEVSIRKYRTDENIKAIFKTYKNRAVFVSKDQYTDIVEYFEEIKVFKSFERKELSSYSNNETVKFYLSEENYKLFSEKKGEQS